MSFVNLPMAKGIIYQYQNSWLAREWDKLLFLLILAIFVMLSPGQNVYTVVDEVGKPLLRRLPLAVPTPAPYPANRTGVNPPEITASGVAVLDLDSGVYLFKRNEDQLFAPASTTKILTALVALEAYQLDEIVTVKTVSNTGQTMGLVPGERLTVENLLFGTLIQSGNDAAWTLGENYPGGMAKFVEAMNSKARKFNLTKSNFTNPVGFDDPNHKVTPLDLARLASVALTNKTVAKMVAIPQITVSDVTHTYFHSLKNINQLLGKIPGVGGIKTGWTEEAGETLVTLVEKGGHRVIVVVLKSQDRFGETAKLIDWVFTNHQWEVVQPFTPPTL